MTDFEWDDAKAETNFKKHGVSFLESSTIWLDSRALEILDSDHGEDRWVRIGMSRSARLLVVVYVEKHEPQRVRIISARKATPRETADYQWRR